MITWQVHVLNTGKEAYYDKPLILADRELVELGADELLKDADKEDIAFLVVGDPLGSVLSLSPRRLALYPQRDMQRDNSHRHSPSRETAEHSNASHSQRFHPQRCWRVWPPAVQLRTGGFSCVLH
jgi:hypothetical protein